MTMIVVIAFCVLIAPAGDCVYVSHPSELENVDSPCIIITMDRGWRIAAHFRPETDMEKAVRLADLWMETCGWMDVF